MPDEPRVTETYDASNPDALQHAQFEERRKAREDADFLRVAMGTKPRRASLYRLLERCHIYGDTFHGEESHLSAFCQGQENIGKQLMLAAMDASPDLYMSMIQEQREEERRLEAVRKRENQASESGNAVDPREMAPDLPPPQGWPGHTPPPKPKPKGNE